MRTTSRFFVLALLLGLVTGVAAAQTVPLDITFGYRFLDLSGNRDEYRTQINDREGLILRNVTFATSDFGGKASFVDHFRFDASDLRSQREPRRIPHADQRPGGSDPAQRHLRDVGFRRQGELRRSLSLRRFRSSISAGTATNTARRSTTGRV